MAKNHSQLSSLEQILIVSILELRSKPQANQSPRTICVCSLCSARHTGQPFCIFWASLSLAVYHIDIDHTSLTIYKVHVHVITQ